MNAPKLFTTLIAASTVVGASLVYAQTTNSTDPAAPAPADTTATMPAPAATTTPAAAPTMPATTDNSATAPADTSAMSATEPAPKADRN